MSFALYLSRARRGDLRGNFCSFDFFSLHSFASIFAKERSRKKKRFKFDDGAVVFGVVAIEQVLIL